MKMNNMLFPLGQMNLNLFVCLPIVIKIKLNSMKLVSQFQLVEVKNLYNFPQKQTLKLYVLTFLNQVKEMRQSKVQNLKVKIVNVRNQLVLQQ